MPWFEVVQGVIEPLVKLPLRNPIGNTKGKKRLQQIDQPAVDHVQGNTIVSNSVHDPRPPAGAQVELWKRRPQLLETERETCLRFSQLRNQHVIT